MSKLGWIASGWIAVVGVLGCGDDDAPPPTPRDAGRMDAACVACDPPTGCRYEGGDCLSCGTLVCEDGAIVPDAGSDGGAEDFDADVGFFDACSPPLCPPPPSGCRYEGATECTCGELLCACGDGECSASEVCRFDSGCAGSGTCVPRPSTCDDGVALVCGCNGTTYNNACDAESVGIAVGASGECPDVVDCRTGECPIGTRCLGCDDGDGLVFSCLPNDVSC